MRSSHSWRWTVSFLMSLQQLTRQRGKGKLSGRRNERSCGRDCQNLRWIANRIKSNSSIIKSRSSFSSDNWDTHGTEKVIQIIRCYIVWLSWSARSGVRCCKLEKYNEPLVYLLPCSALPRPPFSSGPTCGCNPRGCAWLRSALTHPPLPPILMPVPPVWRTHLRIVSDCPSTKFLVTIKLSE